MASYFMLRRLVSSRMLPRSLCTVSLLKRLISYSPIQSIISPTVTSASRSFNSKADGEIMFIPDVYAHSRGRPKRAIGEEKKFVFAYRSTQHAETFEIDVTEFPELSKEDVKHFVEDSHVVIQCGKVGKFTWGKHYETYNIDEIQVEIENSALKAVLPYKMEKDKRAFQIILQGYTEEAWYLHLYMGREHVTKDDMELIVVGDDDEYADKTLIVKGVSIEGNDNCHAQFIVPQMYRIDYNGARHWKYAVKRGVLKVMVPRVRVQSRVWVENGQCYGTVLKVPDEENDERLLKEFLDE